MRMVYRWHTRILYLEKLIPQTLQLLKEGRPSADQNLENFPDYFSGIRGDRTVL